MPITGSVLIRLYSHRDTDHWKMPVTFILRKFSSGEKRFTGTDWYLPYFVPVFIFTISLVDILLCDVAQLIG